MMSRSFALLMAGSALLTLRGAATAQVVVHNNFGAGNTFDTRNGLTESGPASLSPFGIFSQGMGFTPMASGRLSDLAVAIGHTSGTNVAHLFLSDGTSGLPGSLLETFTLTNLPGGSASTPQMFSSALHPLLNAGTRYYLYEQESGDTLNSWNLNNTGESGTLFSRDNVLYSLATATAGAYRVRVTTLGSEVPEPGITALLVGISLPAIGFLVRRRNRVHSLRNVPKAGQA